MKIQTIVVSAFEQNSRILTCEQTGKSVLIDPGDEAEKLLQIIENSDLKIEYILATHGHIDHIGAVAKIQKALQIPFYINNGDKGFIDALPEQAKRLNFLNDSIPRVDGDIEDNSILRFGSCQLRAIHTPGHSPGSISFLAEDDLFVGDVLFSGSVGRTDLPGGSFAILEKSIRERLYVLPPETKVHTGHGPSTTIKREQQFNPYVHL